MIIFPKDKEKELDYYYYEKKLGKDRLKLLEKLLRKLGKFEPKEDIRIIGEEYNDYYDSIYEVKDLDDTSFKFYNYRISSPQNKGRYSQNYYLSMRRKNSNLSYVYDFFSSKGYKREPRLIQINSQLSEHRILTIEDNDDGFEALTIQENEKKYRLSFSSSKIIPTLIEKIYAPLQEMKTVNLEELLNLVGNRQFVRFAGIYINGELIAYIQFQKGDISRYQIVDSSREINAKIGEKVTRKVERISPDSGEKITTEETITDNYEKIQSDLKRLLKQL